MACLRTWVDRRARSGRNGTLVLFDQGSVVARVGAAAGYLMLGEDVETFGVGVEGGMPDLEGRDAVLVDLGANEVLLKAMGSDRCEIMVIDQSAEARRQAELLAGKHTRVLGSGAESTARVVWKAFKESEAVPDLIQGLDWMATGVRPSERSVRIAAGAQAKHATVEQIVMCLSGAGELSDEWEDAGREALGDLESYCKRQAEGAKVCSMGGAKVALAESDRQMSGAVAVACASRWGCIGAAWSTSRSGVELTLRACDGSRVDEVCSAYGGDGSTWIGRVSLSRSALEVLKKGSLRPIEAGWMRREATVRRVMAGSA